jgi:hypothetical protein
VWSDLGEVRDAVEALWTRHEALTAKGIIAPHVFCRGGGQPIKWRSDTSTGPACRKRSR